jgi:alkanesulfonate monooxygenase SsuD/methylene tetrahydromethanopterin reductase-like flavin-dependent oxidoreductase (luciferase family)
MMTHDRPILFGYFLPPTAHNYDEHVKQVHLAEQLGLDLIGIQDHPYQSRHFDTWTLLSALASQTERIRFFPNVTNLPLRPPAMLAKAAASLDVMTRGRIELGLGAGFYWQGITALGGPERQPGEAVEAVEEAIQVMRLMWTGEKGARFSGQHYSLKGAHPGPKPAHPIEIWLGAIGPRMLELTGRLCEGWIPSSPYVPPEKLAESNRRIDEAAHEAGRSPADIRRMYNLMGSITDGPSEDYLKGPVTYWVDEITRLAQEEKMDTFIFAPEDSSEAQIRLFSEEVVPEVLGNLE